MLLMVGSSLIWIVIGLLIRWMICKIWWRIYVRMLFIVVCVFFLDSLSLLLRILFSLLRS